MSLPVQSTLLTRDQLDERRYAQSLLAAARRLNIIGEDFLSRLRADFDRLLVRQCAAYTGGQSGSVRRETARMLSESILFTLGAWMKTQEPLSALTVLSGQGVEACYLKGRQRVDDLTMRTRLFLELELRCALPVENDLLTDTLRGGLPGFFQLYNPEYSAHEYHITADYPVLFYPQGYQGIEFIHIYLDHLSLEHQFLRQCPPRLLKDILSRYALQGKTTVRGLCDNLFEIALSVWDGPADGGSSMQRYLLRARREYAADLARIRRTLE